MSFRPSIVERLLTKPVAGEMKFPESGIPEGKGEHTVSGSKGLLDTPFGNPFEQYFGIGVATEAVPKVLEGLAQFRKIVDFAIQHHGVTATS